jgi:hypothetical protein
MAAFGAIGVWLGVVVDGRRRGGEACGRARGRPRSDDPSVFQSRPSGGSQPRSQGFQNLRVEMVADGAPAFARRAQWKSVDSVWTPLASLDVELE